MKVFVAGAGGVIGRQLLPSLVTAGHEVVGMTRSESKRAAIAEQGAMPVIADGLDPEQVMTAVVAAQPEVLIHELTALDAIDLRHFERSFELTNRLRTEGTDNLLAASGKAGVRRFIAQSYASWPYARTGGPVKTEQDPLDPAPPREMRPALEAIRHLEAAVVGADWTQGLVLRYGAFYGAGTSLSPGGEHFEMVRKRRFPIIGDGAGVWSFINVTDAADATVAAITHGAPGIYNVVDDEPATVAQWLPVLAQSLGARKPWRVPMFVGRLLGGEVATVMMTEIRGASNAKAKRELGWEPRHTSWREGFAA
ncbi:MAG: NAD-dependent epimerase/dehydratase family protein [Solirubrobacteraceae bacterium]